MPGRHFMTKGHIFKVALVVTSGLVALVVTPSRCRYIGETSRNAYSRGKEHLAGLRNKSAISCLWEHCRDVHNLEVPIHADRYSRG